MFRDTLILMDFNSRKPSLSRLARRESKRAVPLPEGGGSSDLFGDICGHKRQLEFLTAALKRKHVAHAYVFAGPEGIGKRSVANRFAQALLCENLLACGLCGQCKSFLARNNADLIELTSPDSIKIEQVRELTYKLSLQPYMARYKVAIIDNAENLTIDAANALLKSLEEPKDHTVIILISASSDRLPKTVLSRTQKIIFAPLSDEEMNSASVWDPANPQNVLAEALAWNRPGWAKKILAGGEFGEKAVRAHDLFGRFAHTDEISRLSLVSDFAELETPELKNMLDFWLIRLEREFLKQPSIGLLKTISEIFLARGQIDQNLNNKLVFSNLAIN